MHGRRARRPKIARLLGEPRAAVARQQIATARSLHLAPTLYLEIRLPRITYLYEDEKHPDRITGTLQAPPYTHEDRCLLMGLEAYEAGLCQCGVPLEVAWHSEMDGYFDVDEVVCHACTARRGTQVVYTTRLRDTRDTTVHGPMPAFVPGKTITAPAKGPTRS